MWIEKVQTALTITCGDGVSYTPNWLNARKQVEYNIAEFDFRNLAGTLVHRGQVRGRRYNVEIYFQGENHLDMSDAFDASAADPKPWTIAHPVYGSLLVQPLSLEFDNSAYNVTRITGIVVETITEDAPDSTISSPDAIAEQKGITDEALSETYANDVPAPKVQDMQDMQRNARSTYNDGSRKVRTTLDAERYFNAFNNANAFIANATAEPLAAMRAIQNMINAPARFADSVRNRLNMLADQFNLLRDTLDSIFSKPQKKLFENNAGTLIGAAALATVTGVQRSTSPAQPGDYSSRAAVMQVVGKLLSMYNQYLEDLDRLQTDNGGSPDSYVPDAPALQALSRLISLSITNLFSVAAAARQERVIYLKEDSNVILVAHELYGLRDDDSSIDELIETNEIGPNEMLQLKKGRRIVYYV